MRHRSTNHRLGLRTVAAAVVVVATALPARADTPPPPGTTDDLVTLDVGVDEALDAVVGAPTTDDDSPGHETEDPDDETHASATVLDAAVGDTDVVTVGYTNSELHPDGSTSGDATVLAVFGNEIVGAHSDSKGQNEDAVEGTAPICESTGGGVCVGLLYAKSSSNENGRRSSSESDVSLLYACIGGTQTEPTGECDGSVGAAVGQSHSDVTRDKSSGETSARGWTELADLCVGGENEAGTCAVVGASALRSESSSRAGAKSSTTRRSHVVSLQGGGQEIVVSEPGSLSVPPDCPATSLICIFINQGETYVYADDGTGGKQEALHVEVPLVGGLLHAGSAESVAHPGPPDIVLAEPPITRSPTNVPAVPGALPFTGVGILAALVWASACIAFGVMCRARLRPS